MISRKLRETDGLQADRQFGKKKKMASVSDGSQLWRVMYRTLGTMANEKKLRKLCSEKELRIK